MRTYTEETKSKAIYLRKTGKTSQEINSILDQKIPKSTFTGWFKEIVLSVDQKKRISLLNVKKLDSARIKAVEVNRVKRNLFFNSLNDKNDPISKEIINVDTAKIALAMLCLGEASKYGSGSAFYLGSSSPKIVVLFIKLLIRCYSVDYSKFRFTIQCRADQNVDELERYWRKVISIEGAKFYKTRVDPRSLGKPTQNIDYKGVLRVDYLDTKIQLDLESLADLLYNQAVSF